MVPAVLDLFGEVPVSTLDIRAWLAAVPRIDPDSARAEHYVIGWDVVGKIKAAKLAGAFERIVAPREPPAGSWWLRFHWT